MTSIDFTTKWSLDLRLVIQNEAQDDKVLYANQEVMSSWSPVFKAMLKDGSFIESESKEVKLPGKSYDDVRELLQLIHPSSKETSKSITLENAYQLLPLVHEYQMQTLVDECEEAIMKDTPTFANLKLAEGYGLKKLRDHSLTKVATLSPLHDIEEDEIYKGFSDSNKMEVLLKKISLMEEKIVEGGAKLKHVIRIQSGLNTCRHHALTMTVCETRIAKRMKEFYKSVFE